MAKAQKTPKKSPDEPTEISAAEASAIPAPLAAAVQEQDTVMQAHVIRQANHFDDMAPTLAKKDRDDKEREDHLNEAGRIQAEWDAHIAQQKAEQAAREEREGAADRIALLETEIAEHEASIKSKTEELERLQKLIGG